MKYALLFLLLPLAAPAQEPVLAWSVEPAPTIARSPVGSNLPLANFRGLLILQYRLIMEFHPLLPTIFFDAGSAAIPDRYTQFTDPIQTTGFSDSVMERGTLERYYSVLNVIGYRLQRHPDAGITIEGWHTSEPGIGETESLALARARVVADYLRDIWQIDQSRITLLVPRACPPKARKDPGEREEYRRVHIAVRDPAGRDFPIVRTIPLQVYKDTVEPSTVLFEARHSIAGAPRRTIEIQRNGRVWHVLTDSGGEGRGIRWNWRNSQDRIPEDETPLVAQLVVHGADGVEHRSPPVTIPVKMIAPRHSYPGSDPPVLVTFPLLFVEDDTPPPTPLNERLLAEYVSPYIRSGVAVTATGHTDDRGPEERNLRRSKERAEWVVRSIRTMVRVEAGPLRAVGLGERGPIYPNALPEGRFYNRTVLVQWLW